MKTSPRGVKLIMAREGKRNKAYKDSRGLWTIGVGHLLPSVYAARFTKWDDAKVLQVLAQDLARFEVCVTDACDHAPTQNEFDAMVSLAFNIGEHGFRGSSVVRMFNLGRLKDAADDFLMWKKPPELLKRRMAERAQFLE